MCLHGLSMGYAGDGVILNISSGVNIVMRKKQQLYHFRFPFRF